MWAECERRFPLVFASARGYYRGTLSVTRALSRGRSGVQRLMKEEFEKLVAAGKVNAGDVDTLFQLYSEGWRHQPYTY